jgi:hypothetical protein
MVNLRRRVGRSRWLQAHGVGDLADKSRDSEPAIALWIGQTAPAARQKPPKTAQNRPESLASASEAADIGSGHRQYGRLR